MIPLRLAISPCPNDTFIFDALLAGQVSCAQNLHFSTDLLDIDRLNAEALRASYDVIKVSYGVVPFILDKYVVLDAGSALGRGVGPLLVAKNKTKAQALLHAGGAHVLSPGVHTTANLLFRFAYPHANKISYTIFSDIAKRVQKDEADCGILIHEGRFTYAQMGLEKVCDIGEIWEAKTQLPIPLGGIMVRRDTSQEVKNTLKTAIRESILIAQKNAPTLGKFVRENAQEMQENVMRAHINLYVNTYSLHMDKTAREAIVQLLQLALTDQVSLPADWIF